MKNTMTTIILILLCVAGLPDAAFSQNTWGICIGISDYSAEELTLQWADKDAIEFSTFLRYGLGLPEEHYRILKNRGATRENIINALGWLALAAKPEDRVYMFYSGHGKSNSPIVPHDLENLISLDTIKKALEKIDAREIIFFADACYSGKIAGKGVKSIIDRENLSGLNSEIISEIAATKKGVVIISSANGIQESYEWDGQKNGLFTYHLMNTLMDSAIHRAIDMDQDNKLSLYELYQNVQYLVSSAAEQQPQISNPEIAKNIIIFPDIPETIAETGASATNTVENKGISGGTKVAIGIGAAAALGGGIVLAVNNGSSDSTETPPDETEKIETSMTVFPQIQETCGSVTKRLFVTNSTENNLTIERIDYEETLLIDEAPTTCRQGRRGSFLADVPVLNPGEWALAREWAHELYPCDGCPYKFTQCSYEVNYTLQTSVGSVKVAPVTLFVTNDKNFCPVAEKNELK
ncbi:MAG: caspase family protein [bacterium]|nr:caspase family protein [bacterium]